MRLKIGIVGALAVVLVLALAGPAFAPPTVTTISGNAYSPQVRSVPPIASLAWQNNDAVEHTATANKPFRVFDTGPIPAHLSSGSVSPAGPGKYPYHCTDHPNMTGTVDIYPYVLGPKTVNSDATIDFSWADAPKGMDRQVQLRREGGKWKTIYRGRTLNEIVRQFSTAGNYQVRGRMIIRKTDTNSKWSSAYTFTIT
jgi:plastocyanin